MAKRDQGSDGKATQKTPKGYDIPILKRSDFMRNLTKAAKSDPPPARVRREKSKD